MPMESRASYLDTNKIKAVDMNVGEKNTKRIMAGSIGDIQSKGNTQLRIQQTSNVTTEHNIDLRERLSFTLMKNSDSMQIVEDSDKHQKTNMGTFFNSDSEI